MLEKLYNKIYEEFGYKKREEQIEISKQILKALEEKNPLLVGSNYRIWEDFIIFTTMYFKGFGK